MRSGEECPWPVGLVPDRISPAASIAVLPRRYAPILISDRSLQLQQPNSRDEEIQTLRDRLTRLSEASLRVSESLNLGTALQEVLESARSLTGARYALIATLDREGRVQDFLGSGLTSGETQGLWDITGGLKFFEYLSNLPRSAAGRRLCWPRQGDGATRVPAPGPGQLLPHSPHPSPRRRRRQHLPWQEPARRGVQPRGRGDPGLGSPPRRRWRSPTPAGTGTSGGPGPTWRP